MGTIKQSKNKAFKLIFIFIKFLKFSLLIFAYFDQVCCLNKKINLKKKIMKKNSIGGDLATRIKMLADGGMPARSIAKKLRKSLGTVTYHLRVNKDEGKKQKKKKERFCAGPETNKKICSPKWG